MAKTSKKPRSKDIEVPDYSEGMVIMTMVSDSNNNKYYNMIPNGDTFNVERGRVGSSKIKTSKPKAQWDATYKSRVKNGYTRKLKDHIVALKKVVHSNNGAFDEFFDRFSGHSHTKVKNSYNAKACTQAQLDSANKTLLAVSKAKTIKTMNKRLIELYTIIPRKMKDVNDYLVKDKSELAEVVMREQDSLDSMDSVNVSNSSDPFTDMNINFSEVKDREEFDKVYNNYQYADNFNRAIHKIYKVETKNDKYTNQIKNSHAVTSELLLHGTRNTNILSILKNGLMIRPSNVHHSGSNYGDGIYHSSDVGKSWGYTGFDKDKIMLVQEVNVGLQYIYDGWFVHGKDIDNDDMNYKWMKNNGYDSMFVKPGGGLKSSEYIVYNENQTRPKYLIWFKS